LEMEITREEKEKYLSETEKVLESCGNHREKLIPVLQQLQDKLGYLPGVAMEKVAGVMDIPAVDVFELATFYNQFRLHPPGEHEFKVCMGTACYMVGGETTMESFQRKLDIEEGETTPDRTCYMVGGETTMESFQRKLDIEEGETTPDRKFSLERVACVGCCTLAPVVVVDDKIEGHVTPTRVDGILLSYENSETNNTSGVNSDENKNSK